MSTTSPSCLRMRCKCQRMPTSRASLVSSVQDTICSRHDRFTMLVSVSHPMSISPVIENVAPAPAAPVVFHAAPATAIERSALQKIGHEHEHIWKRRKNPMMRCTFFFSCLTFPFLFKITRPSPSLSQNPDHLPKQAADTNSSAVPWKFCGHRVQH